MAAKRKKMQITYLGHAGFLVETERAILVTDPWLSPEGAFDSAWFQFPCNHGLASFAREKLRDVSKKRFVYISHEHQDHFDTNFLKTLNAEELTFLVPHFQREALRVHLEQLHPEAMVLCAHGQEHAIPGGSVKLYLDDSGINRDSSILLKSEGQTFLDLNDCKLYDQLGAIRHAEGPISVMTCQFSGATWHPTCYEYGPEEYERISKKKLTGKFEMVARAIQVVHPQTYLPSAGPACFLDPTLLHLNFQPVNIFPRASQFLEFLVDRLPGLDTQLLDIAPGDVFEPQTGRMEKRGQERVCEAEFENYVRSYAARYQDFFADRQAAPTEIEVNEIMRGLTEAVLRKLDAFELHDRLLIPLYFGLSDVSRTLLRVDFPSKTVEQVPEIRESNYYSLKTPSWQIARVLSGAITWEEFALTFRVQLNRRPDIYQTLIQGFLLLEAQDMNWFCGKLLQIERENQRVVIEAGGTRYSIDRHCPHQGGDLSQGWLEEGRLWTCPRHRWQFALDKEGECTSSKGSIHAVCLEND